METRGVDVKKIKGGDIKVVNSKYRWTASKGWHISLKFSRYVRVLSIFGLEIMDRHSLLLSVQPPELARTTKVP